MKKKYSAVPHSMVFEFSGFSDPALLEAAVYLSHNLAMNSPINKRELLIAHYMLVRKTVTNFKDVTGQENIGEETLQGLFKAAIIMAYCGYHKSLRLPEQEKNVYIEENLALPAVEYSFREVYSKVSSVSIPKINIKIPIWSLVGLNAVLLILHWYHEYYVPLDVSQLGLQVTIPSVPAFLTIAFFVTIYVVFRIYRMENSIVKGLKRGLA